MAFFLKTGNLLHGGLRQVGIGWTLHKTAQIGVSQGSTERYILQTSTTISFWLFVTLVARWPEASGNKDVPSLGLA